MAVRAVMVYRICQAVFQSLCTVSLTSGRLCPGPGIIITAESPPFCYENVTHSLHIGERISRPGDPGARQPVITHAANHVSQTFGILVDPPAIKITAVTV